MAGRKAAEVGTQRRKGAENGELVELACFEARGFRLDEELVNNYRVVRELLETMLGHEDWRARIAAAREIGRQTALLERMIGPARQAEAMRQFQAGVIEALEREGVAVRRRVMGLFERSS